MMKPLKSAPFNLKHMKTNNEVRSFLQKKGGVDFYKHYRSNVPSGMGSLFVFNDLIDNYTPDMPDRHEAKQGGYMDRIKFSKWDKVTQKGYAMIQVEGTYIGGDKDGEQFKTRIFSSQKHLVGPVQDANEGDTLAITFKQNGKFRNAIKIVNETADGTAPAASTGNVGTKTGQIPSGVPTVIQDTKVGEARLATEFYVSARAAKIKPEDIPEAFVEALQLADVVRDWKEGKGAFATAVGASLPEEEELDDIDES